MTALVAVLCVLAVHNLGVERLPAALYVPACLGTASALVALAGMGAAEVGLSVDGVGWGLAAGAAMAVLVVVASRVRLTRCAFADRRMDGVGPLGTAYRALIRIPLGTVAVEEIAFRGVLLALLGRLLPAPWAVAGSSLLFGLWHVVPMRATLRTNRLPVRASALAAACVATGLAGLGLCWLRVATGGLAAPAIVHAAASASATVVAYRVGVRSRRGRTPVPPS